jgi:hypothetical protein
MIVAGWAVFADGTLSRRNVMTWPGQITGVHTVGVPVTGRAGVGTGIRFTAADADAVHAAMRHGAALRTARAN